ncbi:hypothetical protein [Hominenteromicrobium sp.]|uniref:hypothetical protein n=1 Tax=Hominenteromicrobium sp. TaxID=3073581 RepID=UPI00399B4088
MIHTDFDPEKTAVIEPSEFYHPMENMPEALIGVFSRPLTEKYAAEFHGEVIMQYQDCNGGEPVYRCTAPNGTAFALMCMRIGAVCLRHHGRDDPPRREKVFDARLLRCTRSRHHRRAHSGTLRRRA